MSAASENSNSDNQGGDSPPEHGGEIKSEEAKDEVRNAAAAEPKFNDAKHRAEIAGRLAFAFVGLFAGALALHYFVYLLLVLSGDCCDSEEISILSDFLHVWLPALTGIVSAAATYYLTKNR